MLVKENMEIGGRAFVKTYSAAGGYIERAGLRYSEAIAPADIPREYTETDEPIDSGEGSSEAEQKAEAWDYLTGHTESEVDVNA